VPLCKQEVTGSIPVGSISDSACKWDGFSSPLLSSTAPAASRIAAAAQREQQRVV